MEFRNVIDQQYKNYQNKLNLIGTVIYTSNLFVLIYFNFIELKGVKLLWLITPFLLVILLQGIFYLQNRSYKFIFKPTYFDAGTLVTKMMIPYEDIVGYSKTKDFKEGNSMMTAEEGIMLHLKNCHWDHLKLTPENEKQFIEMLILKAPHIRKGFS